MLTARAHAPSPVVEYFLDGALEEGEIDGCTYLTCRLYGDDVTMRAIVDGPYQGLRHRRENCDQMDALADSVLEQLPPAQRGALLWEGMVSVLRQIGSLSHFLSGWAVTDPIEGGCAKPFKYPARLHRRGARRGEIHKGLWRQLTSPSYIRRYIKNDTCAAYRRQRCLFTMSRIRFLKGAPDGLIREDPQLRQTMIVQMNNRATPEYRERMERVGNARVLRAVMTPAEIREYKISARKTLRARRRMVKRSARFAVDAIGAENVRALTHGQTVMLPGQSIQIEVGARKLAAIGHSGITVTAHDLAGQRLADLCLYYDDTPALDQISALAIQLQAGLEQEIIDDANIIRATEAGHRHPILVGRKRQLEIPEPAIEMDGLVTRNSSRFDVLTSWENTRRREQLYWHATNQIWTAATTVFCVGAKMAKPIIGMVAEHANREMVDVAERIARAG